MLAAGGTGYVGWKIGTYLRTKILRIGLPDPPQPKASPASGTLRFETAGYNNWSNTTPLPADGWGLRYRYNSNEWTAVNLAYGWAHQCAYLTGPPQGFRVLTGTASIGWCDPPPVPTERYCLREDELDAAGPIEDYVDQPYDKELLNWSDKPQSKLQLEDRTRTALESGEYRFAEPWYAHQLDSQTYEDPTEEDQERDACRPADAVPSGDPAPHRGTEDFTEDPIRWRMRYETVPEGEFPPGSAVPEVGLLLTTGGTACMRWGWAALCAKELSTGRGGDTEKSSQNTGGVRLP